MMTMEAELAKEAAILLVPFLSRLMGTAGTEAVNAAGKKAGEAAWERAIRLWDRLRPQLDAKPDAFNDLQKLAQTTDDPEARKNLSRKLEEILRSMPAEELKEILSIAREKKSEIRITVAKNGGFAIGGDAIGNMISQGEHEAN